MNTGNFVGGVEPIVGGGGGVLPPREAEFGGGGTVLGCWVGWGENWELD